WSLGDCALVPNQMGGFHPPTAQHALRQAKTLALNIAASLRGKPLKPFSFRTIGQLAAIGRRAGVARILGWRFSGFAAWWM
ncbi:MAG: NAD(P)/FAD-dependent oxidoreductase, partial [Acidobacteriaceae bacterium]